MCLSLVYQSGEEMETETRIKLTVPQGVAVDLLMREGIEAQVVRRAGKYVQFFMRDPSDYVGHITAASPVWARKCLMNLLRKVHVAYPPGTPTGGSLK